MNVLFREEINKTEEFTYSVNQGGGLNIKVSNGSDRIVTIKFINDKFDSVYHNLGDFNERSNWHVFKGVAEKINEIEQNKLNRPG